jgi:transposase-like protein
MTGLSEKAVRYWYDHARAQLPTHSIRLSGNVQVDEVYIGGWGGRAVLAAKDIVKKQIVFQVLPTHEVYRENILQFITDYIAPGSIVYTDSSPLYARISTLCKVTHICDNHSRFEFTLTSEIEGLFGNLRTFLRRMYHHVSDEKLEEYVREFQYRFSRKDYFTSPDQFILKTLKLVTLR